MIPNNNPAQFLTWHNFRQTGVPAFMILLLIWPMAASAQMFSADRSPQQLGIPRTIISAGVERMNFDYQGNADEGSTSSAGLFAFKGEIVRLRLETPGINLYTGFGGDATGLGKISYFDAGIRIGSGILIFRDKSFLFQIPLQLHSGYTSVNNNEVQSFNAPGFQEGTFEGALGAALHIKAAPEFRIKASVLPSYGFAFSTRQNNASGSATEVEGKLRFYFDHLFGKTGLSVGYDYNFRQYNISGELLDYRALGNTLLIGISF